MKQYLDLVQHVMENGCQKRRTEPERKCFGHQMRFDLSEGFPWWRLKKSYTLNQLYMNYFGSYKGTQT
jgi:thymidylate synthase